MRDGVGRAAGHKGAEVSGSDIASARSEGAAALPLSGYLEKGAFHFLTLVLYLQ